MMAMKIIRKEESDKEHKPWLTENDTLLHDIAGTGSGHVNSAHHQAIDQTIGESLKVNAYDDDDEMIIEGLE